MSFFEITGGKSLKGTIEVSGAKNVALKAILAGILTDEDLVIENVPMISDFETMVELLEYLGMKIEQQDHKVIIHGGGIKKTVVPLSIGDRVRTSMLALGPLLSRYGHARIPNPGGCRIGARPIDRHIEGLQKMGAHISYDSNDGYFHAEAKKLLGVRFRFSKPTHTGTEALILAAVLAEGETVLENTATEPEVDELILLLNQMGAQIKRTDTTTIIIKGVKKLGGTTFRIMPDRNETVTFAIGALLTKGDVTVRGAQEKFLGAFLSKLTEIGAGWEVLDDEHIRFFYQGELKATDVVTKPYPDFMTDWHSPWAVLMTQARGTSTIHETIFENRLSYVSELKKTGAKIELFNPSVSDPETFYQFNWEDEKPNYFHAITIQGPTLLHNAVMHMTDLRAGATLILAALGATGTSTIYGTQIVDRGYETIEKRFASLGALMKRVKE